MFPDQSPYSLFRNNPLRWTDPTGMSPEDPFGDEEIGLSPLERHQRENSDNPDESLKKENFDRNNMMVGTDFAGGDCPKCDPSIYTEGSTTSSYDDNGNRTDWVYLGDGEWGRKLGDRGNAPNSESSGSTSSSPSGPSKAFVFGFGFKGLVEGGKISYAEILKEQRFNNVLMGTSQSTFKVPKGLKLIGRYGGFAFSAWSAIDVESQFRSGEINSYWRTAEQIANGAGSIPVIGTGVGIGWEAGRWVTQRQWYQRTVHGKWYPPTIEDCVNCK